MLERKKYYGSEALAVQEVLFFSIPLTCAGAVSTSTA